MRHLLLPTTAATTTTATTMPSSSSSSSSLKPPKSPNPNNNNNNNNNQHCSSHPHTHSLLCKHSPSATLDLLILILVLFSGSFLLSSYFSYLFNSLSLLLSHHSLSLSFSFSLPYFLSFLLFFALSATLADFCCGARSRRCSNPSCKGLKKALEFDLQLQTEDSLKSKSSKDFIDRLPWKGGTEANPDYECLRSELRKMAPPNGRAVLLFRARCGCPVAKLEGWGPKRGRRHKKPLLLPLEPTSTSIKRKKRG